MMNWHWRLVATGFLMVSLTAFAFEGYTRMLIAQSFCDTFGGTWLGSWCPREPAGGGGSGAE